MADTKLAEPLMSTEWLTVEGPRHFELYVAEDVLNRLGKELILESFGPTILSETSVPRLMEALAHIARNIDVVLTWTGRPADDDPLQRRLAVTLVSLRHPTEGSASSAVPERTRPSKAGTRTRGDGVPSAMSLLAARGANPRVDTRPGSAAVVLTVDFPHPDGMVARRTTRGPNLGILAELALFDIETAENRWPVLVLPQGDRAEDPVLVLVDLLARDGQELAERGDLAEQVIAAVRKMFPSGAALEVDRMIGADEMPWFVVTARAEGSGAHPDASRANAKTATDRSLTHALRKLVAIPKPRAPRSPPRPSAI